MAELLEAAMRFRDALHQGWCQGDLWEGPSDDRKAFCVIGAAISLNLKSHITVGKLSDFITEELGTDQWITWNDHPDRTHADILDFADCIVRRAKELEESA